MNAFVGVYLLLWYQCTDKNKIQSNRFTFATTKLTLTITVTCMVTIIVLVNILVQREQLTEK